MAVSDIFLAHDPFVSDFWDFPRIYINIERPQTTLIFLGISAFTSFLCSLYRWFPCRFHSFLH